MKIVDKEILVERQDTKITRLEVLSPDIATKARAGQFVVVMVQEIGERIPLTIVDKNKSKGTIVLIFQDVGLTTKLLGELKVNSSLYALVGPLGNPTEIKNYGKVILIGGGVGIAEVYPVANALKEEGNHITTILGARTHELLILEKELRTLSDEIYITTDDGSYEKKGFPTDILETILFPYRFSLIPYHLVYVVGPIPMMRKVALVTKEFNIKTIVSLNSLMVDATGMCGCCRVSIGGKIKFTCVDGPEFDGFLVDWDELDKRNRVYREKEKHICRLYNI
jgi:ferredoxin--NADP+ reductase